MGPSFQSVICGPSAGHFSFPHRRGFIMSDSNSPAPKPPQNDPTREQRPGRRRMERSSTQIFLWAALAIAAIGCFYFFVSDQRSGKEMSLGEFEQHVEDGSLNSKNVIDLRINPGSIIFQDQPAKKPTKAGQTGVEEARAVQRTIIPTYLMGSEKEAELTRLLEAKGMA